MAAIKINPRICPANFLFFNRFPGILLRSDSPFEIRDQDYD
jgi:hypothetical protein